MSIEHLERRALWRDKLSLARSSIWPDVERYARLRMTPAEILTALEIDHKPTFPYPKIENALNKAWKRGILEKRTPEETADARIGVLPQNQSDLRPRVALWLDVASAIEQGEISAHPSTRMEWKRLIDIFSRYNAIFRKRRTVWVEAQLLFEEGSSI